MPILARSSGPGTRLTLIDRYLLRLVAGWSVAGFAVIFCVTLLERSLRVATQMAAAGAHMRFVPAMIWNLAPHYVALGLPDAFLIGMLAALSRLDGDLEIEAMLAGGFPLGRVLAGLTGAAVVVAAVNLLFLGWLEPLGLYGYRAERARAVEAGWTAEIQAWTLNSRGGGDVMLTADAVDATGKALTHILIHRRAADGTETLASARTGRLGLAADGRTPTLTLTDGEALVQPPAKRPLAGVFARYALSDPYPSDFHPPVREGRPQELTLSELAQAPRGRDGNAQRSELAARLARTLVLPILPLLALPLALAGRERRVLGLGAAVLLALLFRQSVRLTQRLGEVGRIEPGLGMTAVFAVFLGFALWVFAANRRLHGDTPLARLLRRAADLFEPLRPRFRASAHMTLAGYLRLTLAQSILATWAVLTLLLTMIDLFERTADIFENDLGVAGLARYAALRAPSLALLSLGLATAIGAAVAFFRLDRGGEMIAVRTSGVSLPGLMRIVLPVGLGLVAVGAVLGEFVTPASQLALAQWWNGPPSAAIWSRFEGEIVRVGRLSDGGYRLTNIMRLQRDADGRLAARVTIGQADFRDGVWRLTGVYGLAVAGAAPPTPFAPRSVWAPGPHPADLVATAAAPAEISARTAWRALEGDAPTNLSLGYLRTRVLRAATQPLAPLIALLLTLPLALAPARTGPGARQLTWALGATLVYVVADGMLAAAGMTSLAPPWMAAFAGPLMFGALAVAAFVRAEL